jgi:ornithine decarboxylase
VEEAGKLLAVAKSLGLNIAGVSFHVGSGCGDSAAYRTALEHSLRVFAEAEAIGFPPLRVVDLGGGFPGDSGGYGGPGMPTFQQLAGVIREELGRFQRLYGAGKVRFIAEPGRYFVSAATSIATMVYSRKGGRNAYQALYVDDGVYGSFNNVVYDHFSPVPKKLALSKNHTVHPAVAEMVGGLTDDESADSESDGEGSKHKEQLIPSAVFGPTCDGLDQLCSLDTTLLPRCEVGDWLLWENMGAYTHTASYVFNGYTHIPNKIYCDM